MSRGRHLVSPPNWPTKDVMPIEEMGCAPDLRATVRFALEAGQGGWEGVGMALVSSARSPGKPIGQ